MLPTPLFPTRAVAALNAVAQALLFPAAFTLNLLLDLRPTTAQRRLRCRWVDVAARAALGSLLAVLLLLAMPAAVVGLLLWLPAQRARRPFAYSCWVPEGPVTPWDGRRRREFTFVSANVCLLPSGLAKFSNLGQTGSRARFLASSLVPQCPTDRQPLVGSGDAKGWGYGGTRTERRGDGGAATEIPRDPKEGLRVTPKEPSEDNRREAVIDMAGDGVKGTPWAPTTTHTPWGGVKDTSKDPTVDTPVGKDTPWNPSKATPRHRDPPMDEDTPWDPTRATPMDKATPWDPTRAAPMDKATPWDPTRATPMDKATPWDPTRATPMDKATPWDPTRAAPMDKATPWDPTRAAPMDKATPWDPTRAAPMDKDTPKDSTSATPRHRDPLQPTFLGSSPQLWERFPPDADFVCLQEVFDPMAEAVLCRQLGLRYPHVFHGVGAGGLHDGGLKLLGSGLLVAARYPPLAASFYCYPNGAGEDALAAKGLLCIQVLLGSQDGRRVLGYLSCTHLQAPERDTAVRSEQLRAALRWGRHFREQHTNTGDVVAFDVLCGDLNFDNCSHGDAANQRHELFRHYSDPCRLGLRREAPWAMGTLLDYLKIYEDPINSPERMRRTLSDPVGRRQFLAGPLPCSPKCGRNGDPKCDPDANGDPNADPNGNPEPTEWHGRRVDYILYREWGSELSTEVSALGFVTALAARSDHLPIALTLSVRPTSGGGRAGTPKCPPTPHRPDPQVAPRDPPTL